MGLSLSLELTRLRLQEAEMGLAVEGRRLGRCTGGVRDRAVLCPHPNLAGFFLNASQVLDLGLMGAVDTKM
jgi:hypothetical protein